MCIRLKGNLGVEHLVIAFLFCKLPVKIPLSKGSALLLNTSGGLDGSQWRSLEFVLRAG